MIGKFFDFIGSCRLIPRSDQYCTYDYEHEHGIACEPNFEFVPMEAKAKEATKTRKYREQRCHNQISEATHEYVTAKPSV